MKELNFIHLKCSMEFATKLLDGWPAITGRWPPATGFTFKFIQEGWTMANIAVEIGLFPSLTQARKNGWNEEIPRGFTRKVMKKQRIDICILNIIELG